MSAFIETRSLDSVRSYFEQLPEIADQAMALAINESVTREGMTALRREMRNQTNFPTGYLESKDRLKVRRMASRGRLEAVIRGRDRPTSLARFAEGQTPENTRGRGVRVKLKGKGAVRQMNKAFMVNLRGGNTGVAIRLKGGQTPNKAYRPVRLDNNLWLLYGPSVDQVFNTVANDKADEISDMVVKKFLRQFSRLSTRG